MAAEGADAPQPRPEARPRPQILGTKEGEWVELPPPDRQPHFRCVVRSPGAVILRWQPRGFEPPASSSEETTEDDGGA